MRKALFLVGAMLAITPTTSTAEPLVIQGSTTFNARLLAPYKSAIESMSGVALTVIPNKSANGLIALLEGRADMAMISAPLEKEIASLPSSTAKEVDRQSPGAQDCRHAHRFRREPRQSRTQYQS